MDATLPAAICLRTSAWVAAANQKASRMALTMERENSLLMRSSALDSCVKNEDGSTNPLGSLLMELVASYSSRIEMAGLLHRTTSFATSRSWMFAVTVIV